MFWCKGGDETRVIIKGTTEQIAVALSMVQEKVEIELEERRKMEFCQANRSPRNRPKSSSTASPIKNVTIIHLRIRSVHRKLGEHKNFITMGSTVYVY